MIERLGELRAGIGQRFNGWKGGSYLMSASTPLWVARPGETGSTAIVGVEDHDWFVVLQTAYREDW